MRNLDASEVSAILDEVLSGFRTLNKLLLNVVVVRRDNRENKS